MTPAELMTKAYRAVRSSSSLLADGDLDGAVNRAYYGMFHAARAALASKCIDTDDKKHGTVIGLFGLHFVKQGPLPSEMGRALNEVQELRTESDYDIPVPAQADAEKSVKDAESFVSMIEAYLTAR